MSPRREPVPSSPNLPEAADVVVVGAGIVGITAAYSLAERGLSVVVVEKGEVAGEQSSRNWGFLRQQGRSPAELPLIKKSVELWERLQKDSGFNLGMRRTGTLYVTDLKDPPEAWQGWLDTCRDLDIGVSMMSGEQVNAALPSTIKWTHGIHTPTDGFAEPDRAVPLLARAAKDKGVVILQGCAARLLDIQAGKVAGLHTERGLVRTSAVLCAAGAWSNLFCGRHGIDFPQLVAKASVLRTGAVAELAPFGGIGFRDFTIRRRDDGGYNIARPMGWTFEMVPNAFKYMKEFWPAFMQQRQSMKLRLNGRFLSELKRPATWAPAEASPFEELRVWDPPPDNDALRYSYEALKRAFPQLGNLSWIESWGGMIDITPDAAPVIGPAPLPGLFIATGFSGHGFAMGPGGGRLAADLIAGAEPLTDPEPYRFERLSKARISRDLSPN